MLTELTNKTTDVEIDLGKTQAKLHSAERDRDEFKTRLAAAEENVRLLKNTLADARRDQEVMEKARREMEAACRTVNARAMELTGDIDVLRADLKMALAREARLKKRLEKKQESA